MTDSLRSAYHPHLPVHPAQGGPSLTKQSMQKECDINNIMKRYEKTGLIEHVKIHQGNYGNFVTHDDYHGHLNQVMAAQASFDTLPASIRKTFDNDPAAFLDFVQNPDNETAMIEMGLRKGPHNDDEGNPLRRETLPLDPKPSAADTPADPATPVDSTEPANLAGSQASPPSVT